VFGQIPVFIDEDGQKLRCFVVLNCHPSICLNVALKTINTSFVLYNYPGWDYNEPPSYAIWIPCCWMHFLCSQSLSLSKF